MIFAPPGANIIEFLPMHQLRRQHDNPRPCYHYMAHGLQQKYWMVEPEVSKSKASAFFHTSNMLIDVRQVLAILVQLGIAIDIPVVTANASDAVPVGIPL